MKVLRKYRLLLKQPDHIAMPAHSRVTKVGQDEAGLFLLVDSEETEKRLVHRAFDVFSARETLTPAKRTWLGNVNDGHTEWRVFERLMY